MHHFTPKNQMSKELANELFRYEDGKLYWRKKTNHKTVLLKPIGNITKKGYMRVNFKRKEYKLQNIIWNMNFGYIEDGFSVDHIDRNRLNNKIENLRLLTPREQIYNRCVPKNNTSGVVGVYWSAQMQMWRASTKIDYKEKHLGYFKNISDAIKARKDAESEEYKALKYNNSEAI